MSSSPGVQSMLPPDLRNSDKMSYYTMKTPGLAPPGPSSQSYLTAKTNTPLASPRLPYSVGQPCPPKLSPTAGRGAVQSPSPNYFSLAVEPALDPRDSSAIPHENWSPASSSVKPFAAALPKHLPIDANPDFEAFRRQIDANLGRSAFNLSAGNFSSLSGNPNAPSTPASAPSAIPRPRLPRWHTHGSDVLEGLSGTGTGTGTGTGNKSALTSAPAVKMDVDTHSLHDSAYVSSDSKRNSESSLDPSSFLNMGQFESPAQMESPFPVPERRRQGLSASAAVQDRQPHFSRTQGKPDTWPALASAATQRPAGRDGDAGPSMMTPSQLKDLIRDAPESAILILDVRVSPQYAQSRISGALNLCIPTTLLKRATFNLQKLQQTFQGGREQEKFAKWRDTTHLVVYDASSSDKRDATSALNMLKKFANEGYTGSANILRGGFKAFAASYPDLIDSSSSRSPATLSLGSHASSNGGLPVLAPVIGGVMLPVAVNNSNPFFSNIRQNQDLVDGVGQLDIAVPPRLDPETLPRWLRDAAEKPDHGKKVSDRFLEIELREKSRMTDAYSVFVPPGVTTDGAQETKVRLSGIEQGDKNRYKDILPFEHARVHLGGKPAGGCDYVNASHLKASRSHKRYIATQGPLPATFEDFWSVIWDQDVRVIVMLTAESEGGQLKCHQYWKDREFGALKLRSLSEKKVSLDLDKHRSESMVTPGSNAAQFPFSSSASHHSSFSWNTTQAEMGRRRANTTTTLESSTPTPAQPNLGGSDKTPADETPYVIIRKFALSHAAHPFSPMREITQMHYPSWPDFGAPAEPSHLLALVELANVMQRAVLPINISGSISSVSTSGGGDGQANGSWREGGGPRMVSRGNSDVVPVQWHDAPESNENSRPMLVHCSAGCGRTGAFCTIDTVIDMLKRQRLRAVKKANKKAAEGEKRIAEQMIRENIREKRRALGKGSDDGDVPMDRKATAAMADDGCVSPLATFQEPPPDWPGEVSTGPPTEDEDDEGIDLSWLDDESVDLIARTVEDFRGQRLSMVQSLRQFVLCYEAMLEWVWRVQQRGSSSSSSTSSSSSSTAGGASSRGGGRARSGSLAM